MKLTIEGTKDEIVELVRELGDNEMLLTNAHGPDVTRPPKPVPCTNPDPDLDPGTTTSGSPCADSWCTSTSGAPDTDPVVVVIKEGMQ